MSVSISEDMMPKISDLSDLKPIRSSCNSDRDFETQIALWEEKIAPVIERLESIAQTRPVKANFQYDEEFEEAFGFWMGRQGKVISINLSEALRKWKELNISHGDSRG